MRSKAKVTIYAIVFSVVVATPIIISEIRLRKARELQEMIMDSAELHCDADGPFVMIDSEHGLIGVYNGTQPLEHFWTEEAKKSPAGVYSLVIYSDRIGLGRPETEWIHEIRIPKKDMNIISENMQPGIPVLVF